MRILEQQTGADRPPQRLNVAVEQLSDDSLQDVLV